MHAFYIFRHSAHQDEELRFSLRSVARHMPWIEKVWIFGDRPAWLADDVRRIEHVPHERVAWIVGLQTRAVNQFQLLYLSALFPGLSPDYMWFCDDYILLDDVSPQQAAVFRYVEDLDQVQRRGQGLFRDAVWRTYDLLKRFGYPRLNYEAHVPIQFNKSWVLDAVQTFRDFMTADRFYGMLSQTAVASSR